MLFVVVVVAGLFTVAGGLALFRIVRGPSTLDRMIATDVLLAITMIAIAAEAAYQRDGTALPVLVVLSILGFTGSVAVARFTTREHP